MSDDPSVQVQDGDPPEGSTEVTPVEAGAAEDAKASAQDGAAPSTRTGTMRGKRAGLLKDLPVLILVAFVIALLIKTFLVQAFFIPSPSMVPTLRHGDRVLVNRLVYRFHPPRRGDVIVFSDPNPETAPHRSPPSAFWHWLTQGIGFGSGDRTDFIKRVIGLPGETVEIHSGRVFIDGVPLKEPYLSAQADLRSYGPYHVPAGDLFVMGDNRAHSDDSRGTLHYVPISNVIGRAFAIVWPPGHWRWLSGVSYA